MSVPSRPQPALEERSKALGTLRHALERVEGVWQDSVFALGGVVKKAQSAHTRLLVSNEYILII